MGNKFNQNDNKISLNDSYSYTTIRGNFSNDAMCISNHGVPMSGGGEGGSDHDWYLWKETSDDEQIAYILTSFDEAPDVAPTDTYLLIGNLNSNIRCDPIEWDNSKIYDVINKFSFSLKGVKGEKSIYTFVGNSNDVYLLNNIVPNNINSIYSMEGIPSVGETCVFIYSDGSIIDTVVVEEGDDFSTISSRLGVIIGSGYKCEKENMSYYMLICNSAEEENP